MPDIGAALQRPVGPLPVWGWGVVIGVGYLAYRHFAGGSTASTGPSYDFAGTSTSGVSGTAGTSGGTSQSLSPADANAIQQEFQGLADQIGQLSQNEQTNYNAIQGVSTQLGTLQPPPASGPNAAYWQNAVQILQHDVNVYQQAAAKKPLTPTQLNALQKDQATLAYNQQQLGQAKYIESHTLAIAGNK